jgi:hypothetical protein
MPTGDIFALVLRCERPACGRTTWPTTTGATGGNPEAGRRGAKAWHPDGAGSIHSAGGDAGSATQAPSVSGLSDLGEANASWGEMEGGQYKQ